MIVEYPNDWWQFYMIRHWIYLFVKWRYDESFVGYVWNFATVVKVLQIRPDNRVHIVAETSFLSLVVTIFLTMVSVQIAHVFNMLAAIWNSRCNYMSSFEPYWVCWVSGWLCHTVLKCGNVEVWNIYHLCSWVFGVSILLNIPALRKN